jgi:hypothetical protein
MSILGSSETPEGGGLNSIAPPKDPAEAAKRQKASKARMLRRRQYAKRAMYASTVGHCGSLSSLVKPLHETMLIASPLNPCRSTSMRSLRGNSLEKGRGRGRGSTRAMASMSI